MTEYIKEVIAEISGILPEGSVLIDEPMSAHTSFRIGGPADALVIAGSEEELAGILGILNAHRKQGEEIPYLLIGNGSNFLVSDDGYPGIMIRLGGEFDSIEQDPQVETLVRVGAAKLLSGTSAYLMDKGLAGFEFASGIPGSIGGAVFMNAGAYGGEMKDIVRSVRLMKEDSAEIVEFSNREMDFSYRHSIVEEGGLIVCSALFILTKDDPEAISSRIRELQAKRNAKQPINYPSAGSTFKRPEVGYAAALIDQAGLKGYRVGGAEVSEKHAGFVINIGGATAEDVLAVMRHVRSKVLETSGIELKPEVRLINCSL